MNDAAEIVGKAFDGLVERHRVEGGMSRFSPAERVVYLVVVARCESEMNGFESVFDQALARDELLELIGALRRLEEARIAGILSECLSTLEKEGLYDEQGRTRRGVEHLAPAAREALAEAAERLGDALWDLDGKLAERLKRSREGR